MSIIKQALEHCNTRAQSSNVTINQHEPNQGFTYNDGKGLKDNVILSGPLSEVYTQALNISLKKKPLAEEPEAVDPNEDKPKSSTRLVSVEGMVEDTDVQMLALDLDSDTAENLSKNYEFKTMDLDPIHVSAHISVQSPKQALQPEVVEELTSYHKANPIQDTILVVTVPTEYGAQGSVIKEKLINLGGEPVFDSMNVTEEKEFKQAMETLYVKENVKVYYGKEGFRQALKYLSDKMQ